MVSAGPCLADSTSGTPKVGDDVYGLKITVNVVGTPAKAFRIKWTLGSIVYYFNNISVSAGNGWWWYFTSTLNLDDPIPWSVTLDPDGVSGDSNTANNTMSGTFTPTPPAVAVETYAPRMMQGWEKSTLQFQPGSGTLSYLDVLYGAPTSHGTQQVLGTTAPAAATRVITTPYSLPIYEIARANVAAGTFEDTESFVVQLSRQRVNPTILRQVTWADIDALTPEWTIWTQPDQMVQSTDAAIHTFVQQSLTANYRTAMTPYDAARTLHRAVMKKLTYQLHAPHEDAAGVLGDGIADCGGYAGLLTASLRNIGIPARRISGFRQGSSVWHVRMEFHLPGCQWIVADPCDGNAADPTGVYAYSFCCLTNSDSFVAMDVGDSHQMAYHDFAFLQSANWWWGGGATFVSHLSASYLQPFSTMRLSAKTSNQTKLDVTNVPTEGSIVIERSTDLLNWSQVTSFTASGSDLSYTVPSTAPKEFYRARVAPP